MTILKNIFVGIFISATFVFSVALSTVDVAIAAPSKKPSPPPGADWSTYSGDHARSKYSPLNQINKNNVKKAKVVWRWSSPDNDVLAQNPKLFTMFNESTPLGIDGFLYVSTQLGQIAKIDGSTGKTVWVYDPKSYEGGEFPPNLGFVHRGVTYWQDATGTEKRIVMGTPDAFLISIDANSGKLVSSFGTNGTIDLLKGLARNGSNWPTRTRYGVSSPVTICKDTIVVGSTVADLVADKKNPPGDVRGFDAATGKLKWTFRTIPLPGNFGHDTWFGGSADTTGNANVWTTMSADPDLGLVYLPTSTASNDYFGGERPGDNLFAESLVALDCETGKRNWHFQTTHHGLWDYDLPASPNLMDITVDGRDVKAVVQVTKQAFAFAFDRVTGQPIWPILETPVASSKIEESSPTQPIPTLPKPFDTQGVTDDNIIDFPRVPELRAEALDIVNQYVRGPLYTPPLDEKKGLLILPGNLGGASWAGAAFHPEKQKLYIPSITRPNVAFLEKSPLNPDGTLPPFEYRYSVLKTSLTTPAGQPVTQPIFKPPYGRLTAIDMKTGLHSWQIPLGIGPKNDARVAKAIVGTEWENKNMGWDRRSFPLLTKDLLFVGQTGAIAVAGLTPRWLGVKVVITEESPLERNLKVFDQDSGDLIHEIDLMEGATPSADGKNVSSGNTYGSPMTFLNQKGRQVIVVPVGGANLRAEFVGIELEDSP